MALIIDGKKISQDIKNELKDKVEQLHAKGVAPCLAVIQVGNDPASSVYVRNKKRGCEEIGIASKSFELPESTTEEELLALVDSLNKDSSVSGLLIQLPLPPHIDSHKVTQAVIPEKDVDGFSERNVGKLNVGSECLESCTPAGVIQLLECSGIQIDGKRCVVIGRSNIVGKPMATMLLKKNGTVTICHSHTEGLTDITKQADILVCAAGKPKMVTAEYVKPGAAVIDVGIHRMENGKLCGDVDFDSVEPVCGAITPVPGGVGPMTIAMLMCNCVKAAELAAGLI